MANGHSPTDLRDMIVGDIEAIAVYHMTHNPVPTGGEN